MAEYIWREAAIKAVEKADYTAISSDADDCKADYLRAIIESEPAADVVPVVHGRWEYNPPTINTYGQLRCSICNWWTLDPSVDRSYSYCPNCGAKMDGNANG